MNDRTMDSRRWFYLGIEIHYGCRYHMWENSYTGRRFAWYVPYYKLATTDPAYARGIYGRASE